MTEAQNLVLKYFHIVCRISDKDSPIDYDKMMKWASESTFYKSMFQTAIQCAISEMEAVINAIEKVDTIALNERVIYNELKQMP